MLNKEFRQFREPRGDRAPRARRRVRALLDAGMDRSAEIEHERAAIAEQERQRHDAEAMQQGAEHLAALAERESAAWRDVERLVSSKTPATYDDTVVLLSDLRALAVLQSAEASFAARLERVRKRHERKSSFIACAAPTWPPEPRPSRSRLVPAEPGRIESVMGRQIRTAVDMDPRRHAPHSGHHSNRAS